MRTSLLAPIHANTPILGDTNSPFAQTAAGPTKEPGELANMSVNAIEKERFLILSDEIVQT